MNRRHLMLCLLPHYCLLRLLHLRHQLTSHLRLALLMHRHHHHQP
jgi:hypothetical protein